MSVFVALLGFEVTNMLSRSLFFTVCCLVLCTAREASATPVLGTLVNDFRLEWDASVGADGTLYRPYLGYWDRAHDSTIDINIGPLLHHFASPYQNTYTIENFPGPVADNLPYGGFLSYYQNADMTEGMIVGLAPDYTPVDDFDTLFNPQDLIFGVSETDALNALKNPVPGTSQTPGGVFRIMTVVNPDAMPRWQYDATTNQYSLSMNLFAFSTPQLIGKSESVTTFTANIPEPTSLTVGLQATLAAWLLARARRGNSGRWPSQGSSRSGMNPS